MTSYPRTRTRQEQGVAIQYDRYDCNGSLTYPLATSPTRTFAELDETCVDEIHTDYPKEGGPFCVRKITYAPQRFSTGVKAGYDYTRVSNGITTYYSQLQRGAFVQAPPAGAALPSQDSCEALAKAYGAEAWNRFSPKPYVKNLGQFFGELRESFAMLYGVRNLVNPFAIKRWFLGNNRVFLRDFDRMEAWPALWSTLRRFARNSASGYLALEFGWKPFVQDVAKLIRSVSQYDARLEAVRKNQNQWVRHGGTLRDVTSSPVVSTNYSGYKHDCFAPSMWVTPTYHYETTTSERVWFKGKFRYFVPGLEDQSFLGKADRLATLYGLKITPWLVWKLIPWTWLVDWFSNVDHILGNLSDMNSHHLVAKYAYLMRRTEVSRAMIYRVKTKFRGYYSPATYMTSGWIYSIPTTNVITKTRVAASPFGFDLDWPDFDSWRLSILMALGISRAL